MDFFVLILIFGQFARIAKGHDVSLTIINLISKSVRYPDPDRDPNRGNQYNDIRKLSIFNCFLPSIIRLKERSSSPSYTHFSYILAAEAKSLVNLQRVSIEEALHLLLPKIRTEVHEFTSFSHISEYLKSINSEYFCLISGNVRIFSAYWTSIALEVLQNHTLFSNFGVTWFRDKNHENYPLGVCFSRLHLHIFKEQPAHIHGPWRESSEYFYLNYATWAIDSYMAFNSSQVVPVDAELCSRNNSVRIDSNGDFAPVGSKLPKHVAAVQQGRRHIAMWLALNEDYIGCGRFNDMSTFSESKNEVSDCLAPFQWVPTALTYGPGDLFFCEYCSLFRGINCMNCPYYSLGKNGCS